jgi:hypothetical protein
VAFRADELVQVSAAITLLGQSWLLEYLGAPQELQSRNGPRFNTILPGKIYQVTHLVNFFFNSRP